MAYTINNYDGTTLLTLPDGTIDQVTTSVTLIGKNVSAYGQYYNDNLISMLQHFASNGTQPQSPLVGQLWYNKIDGRIYVYNIDNIFKPIAAAQVSPTVPPLSNIGDLWIDTTNKQLFFTIDGNNYTLAGPQYSSAPNASINGWKTDTILDVYNNLYTVASLYNNNNLIAIATTATFSFANVFNGMSYVLPGINLNPSIPGLKFVGDATNADSVSSVTNFLIANYLQINPSTPQTTSRGLSVALTSNDQFSVVKNGNGVTIAPDSSGMWSIENSNKSVALNQYLPFNVKVGSAQGYIVAISVDPGTPATSDPNPSVSIFPPTLQSVPVTGAFNVYSDVNITGNLTVTGATTNIQTTNLDVEDKVINLAYGNTLDSQAEGGGINLIGNSTHYLTWTQSYGGAWQSRENFNLVSPTSSYNINGQPVVNANSLGTVITSAPGITSFGVLNYLTVTNVTITTSTISTTATGADATLYLNAAGFNSTIDVSGKRITSVAVCTTGTDAANKQYVDDTTARVGTRGFVLSMDVTNMRNPDTDIIPYLTLMLPIDNPNYPIFNIPVGSRVRVLCASTEVYVSSSTLLLNYTRVDISGTSVVADVNGFSQGFTTATTTTYVIRQYNASVGNTWTFVSTITNANYLAF
jgi:hypothetical protein